MKNRQNSENVGSQQKNKIVHIHAKVGKREREGVIDLQLQYRDF